MLMTSLAKARAAGISRGSPDPRLGRRIGGRAARLSDPRPVLREPSAERRAEGGDGSRRRRRQGVRRDRALQLLSLRAEDGAANARASGADVQPTVTGGLTFFGAPLNTYMTHAACAMVRQAARRRANSACSTARAASSPSITPWCCRGRRRRNRSRRIPACRAEADRNSGAVPEFVTEAGGKGTVESFTALYGRNGEVEHGVVMLRTADNARTLARVPASDRRDARASPEHGPHAGRIVGRYRHRGRWRAGVAGGMRTCPGRGAASFTLLRRAGTHHDEAEAAIWAPAQRRTAHALRRVRGTRPS